MGKRISHIDAAKGLAMILVVIGHCHWKGHVAGSLIYSFHMPLFFIISGLFVREMGVRQSILRNVVSYVRPYLITCGILLVISLVTTALKDADLLDDAWKCLKTAFWGGKCEGGKGHFVGPLWFLLALFWASVCYTMVRKYVEEPYRGMVVVALFFLAILSYQTCPLPLCLQSGLAAMVFLWIGDLFTKYDVLRIFGQMNVAYKIILLLLWLLCVHFTGAMDLAKCNYGYGMRIPASVIASLLFIDVLRMIHAKGGWMGRSTLYLLCGHQIGYFVICQLHLGLRNLPYAPWQNFVLEFGAFMSTTLVAAYVLWSTALFEKKK